ncbi:hypothetical protein FA047_16045 [Pedobacter frigoris]|uniref:O-antigen ligase family protein n=2 Tax=Pedobacter frigoris TaxID=2571272 RepID=A0A4U1CFY6_9SPHI|nr:hypothetical protein FA047_16045 [Pedobacter frigoris]
MGNIRSYLVSITFIFLFIAPFTISIFLSESNTKLYYLLLVFCYGLYAILNIKGLISKIYVKPLLLSVVFLFFGVVNVIVKGELDNFFFVAPIITYFAYYYVNNNRIKSKVMDFYIIFLYIYYGIVYYATLPSLLIHPELEDFFGKASSNAIPLTLNISLYAYMILNKYYNEKNNRKIVFFASLNLVLILIQQSRAGIVIAVVILLIASYEYSKKLALKMLIIISVLSFFFITYYYHQILEYIDIVGTVDTNSIKDDIRGEAQSAFFQKMSFQEALFGYKDGDFAGMTYTYNNFLDIWNKYGIIPLIIVSLLFVYRFIFYKLFKYPLYYFVPFFVYSLVESRFFPNFWDIIIYLMLFALARTQTSTVLNKKSQSQNDKVISTI